MVITLSFLDMAENHKMIVENSGLLTVAALKHLDFKGKKVVSVLSGGNMDVLTMATVVQNGLILRDRIFTVSVMLPDKPGQLADVSALIAKLQGNVIKLDHNVFANVNRSAGVLLTITMETFGTEHKKQILQGLEDPSRPTFFSIRAAVARRCVLPTPASSGLMPIMAPTKKLASSSARNG